VLAALKKAGYKGWLSNEDFSTELPTDAKLKDDITFLNSLI